MLSFRMNPKVKLPSPTKKLGWNFIVRDLKVIFWRKSKVQCNHKNSFDSQKFGFQLQISKICVWLDFGKALEPLFDLQEAQGKTSNMAPKPSFRRGNLEKSSAPRWSDAPNLGAPKFFWEFPYTYILIIKRVFVVTTHFTFFSKDDPQIPDYPEK